MDPEKEPVEDDNRRKHYEQRIEELTQRRDAATDEMLIEQIQGEIDAYKHDLELLKAEK